MNRILKLQGTVCPALIAASCLLLASCESSFDAADQAFSRATQQRLSKDFQKQAAILTAAEKSLPGVQAGPKIPATYAPWWRKDTAAGLFPGAKPTQQSLEDLFASALMHSSQIKVFRDIPLIRHTGIQEARGEFDTHVFAEATYEYVDEPVGSTLTTGLEPRFREHDTRLKAGVRKKLVTGADVTLSQEVARTLNNSIYFVPDRQASARLALTVVQPLLKGGGIEYNRSYIRIAKFDTEIAKSEYIRQTESHLLSVARAYWNVYMARALCIQKRKLLADATDLVGKLSKRKDIDALKSQLMRAKAAQAKRRADLVRAEMAVKNAEDRIRALVNDPKLLSNTSEIVPGQAPTIAEMKVNMKDVAAAALENRPEIRQAFLQLKTAAVRKKMSKNELLPQLDLILQTSISGLDKAGAITDGWDDQWQHPGFLVGLRFDFPMENNTAKARHQRREIEIRQQLAQLQTTVDTVLLEAKISARELATSYRELHSRYQSLQAAEEDLRTLTQRWESHAGAGKQPAIGYLELLVEAQDRLGVAQEDFVRSNVLYNVAMINLQRAQGTLLKYDVVQKAEKRATPVKPAPPAPKKAVKPDKPAKAPAKTPAKTLAKTPAKAAAKTPVKAPAKAAATQEAEGILSRSEIFANKYILREPKTDVILTFIIATDARVNLDTFIGKRVKAIGIKNEATDTLAARKVILAKGQPGK